MEINKTKTGVRIWTWVLFAGYLVLLVWTILFKFGMAAPQFGAGVYRMPVNFIPFGAPMLSGGRIDWDEMLFNVFAFLPLGLFLSILAIPRRAWLRVLIGLLVSAAFEALQYVFALGSCDVTDVILNTAGTALGVGLYYLLIKLLKGKTETVVDIVITAGAALLLTLYAIAMIFG